MRLAGWNYGYGKTPLEDAVAHMAGVGYAGMELATGEGHSTPLATLDDARVREIAALTGRHGLPVVAVSALFNLVPDDEAAWRDEWARWRRAIDVAALLGRSEGVPTTPFVACGSGAAPPGLDRPRLWSALRDNTRRVVEYAAERGVTVAIEPHWGAAVERPGDAVELIEAIGSPNLRANCDVCHPFALGYDLESIARILGRHTVYAHLCDVRGRHPGGPPPAGHQLVNPGEGEIDWAAWLGLLQRNGHDGWITVQISVMRQAWPGYDPRDAMERSYRVLSAALPGGRS